MTSEALTFEGERVHGVRVKVAGTTETTQVLHRGDQAVAVIVGTVKGIQFVPFDGAPHRIQTFDSHEVFVTDEETLGDVLAALRDAKRKEEDELIGRVPLPLDGEEGEDEPDPEAE